MLKCSLPEYAFHGRGPDVGPEVILTDNCKEERERVFSVRHIDHCLLKEAEDVWAISLADAVAFIMKPPPQLL